MNEQGAVLGARLRERDLSAAPAALNLLESSTTADREQAVALLREVSPAVLGGEAQGHIIGVTGPPGAGKSTLLSALLRAWREQGQTVAILAIDPSSKRSGGSLLGDRARIDFPSDDEGVMIRSTATGDKLGGLATSTRAAAQAMAAAFDIVVIETVGVGQAETDVADLADTVIVVVQPGSGDVLQFLKSGIMETPDVLVVTKADLGPLAAKTKGDLSAALRSVGVDSERDPVLSKVVAVSSVAPTSGIDELLQQIGQHWRYLKAPFGERFVARRLRSRRMSALAEFTREHGERGLEALGGTRAAKRLLDTQDIGLDVKALIKILEKARSLEESATGTAGEIG